MAAPQSMAALEEDDFEQFQEDAESKLESDLASSSDESMDDSAIKDEAELQLERIVFGDSEGFKNEIRTWDGTKALVNADNANTNDLSTIEDAELFFLDAAPDKAVIASAEHQELNVGKAQPVWADSDDDRMMVSLTAVPRLKKLRHFVGEDVVSAREYQRRLRLQYEALHPCPKWARWSVEEPATKRRKQRRDSDSNDDSMNESASDSDIESTLSAPPLARLLRTNTALTRTAISQTEKRIKLRPEVIAIERMKDISPTQHSAITSLSIHPDSPIVMSSGPSSMLYLHHLHPYPIPPDPPNPLITSLHLKHTPLTSSAFSPSPGSESGASPRIYLSSRRRYFHVWDLPTGSIKKVTRVLGHAASQRSMEVLKPSPCGRYIGLLGSSRKGGGVVNILDALTTFWIAQVVVESRKGVTDFQWWADGEGMTIAGRGGEISEWDVASKSTILRWNDEGAVGLTTFALGGRNPQNRPKKSLAQWYGPDRYIAIGSTAGIVNVYDRAAIFASSKDSSPAPNPSPVKTLDNLTTPISHLHFSPCGQVMVMASRWKRDALRLVHLPSCTVYRNWPTSKTPLGRISAVALGEYEPTGSDSKRLVLMIGNEAGALRGWEINAS